MPCTPTSVRTTPPQSGPTLSLLLNVTVQVRSPHTLWSAQGCRALPCECAHHPLASQSGQHHHQCFKCNPSSPRITCTECWGDIRLLLLLTLMTVLKGLTTCTSESRWRLLVSDGSGRRCVTSLLIVYKNGLLTKRGCDW